MPKTRYAQLVDANVRNYQLFRNYEDECRGFIQRLRNGLVAYLECSEEKVGWLVPKKTSKDQLREKEVKELSLDQRMALYNNAFYGFQLRITFDSRWIDLRLTVKKIGDCFIVPLGKERRTIHKNKQEDLDALIEYLFNRMKEYLETEFENFIHEEPLFGFLGLVQSDKEK